MARPPPSSSFFFPSIGRLASVVPTSRTALNPSSSIHALRRNLTSSSSRSASSIFRFLPFSSSSSPRLSSSPFTSSTSTSLFKPASSSHRSLTTTTTTLPTLPTPPPLPVLTTPAVVNWLYLCSFLTFSIIVVGGLTRLTESGLSITEWRPIEGMLPPRGKKGWEEEFEKYRKSEEGMILNAKISLEEFKFIFYMEWAHRNLGRLIGVVFVLPGIYFAARGRLSVRDRFKVVGLAGGIGFQGALGWYMVSSGLDAEHLSNRPNSTPRVSQYRLAAHLGAALTLYVGMMHTALAARQEWNLAHPKGGVVVKEVVESLKRRNAFRRGAWALAGLVLFTAVSGAFVAGLDAGLIYNEFPYMGESIVPPLSELYDPAYARRADKGDSWWRNMLENPTTVQFDHRVLASIAFLSIIALTGISHSPLARRSIPRQTGQWLSAASAVVSVQVALGISTLLYLVPTPLAAMHQAGSVVLLTTLVGMLVSLRRPSAAVRAWRGASARVGKVGGGGEGKVKV